MALTGFKAQNHPQQTAARGADDATDDRETTPAFFLPYHQRFAFTVDVAASANNAKLPRFYDRAADGLSQSWADERVWCNPPYSDCGSWVRKAWSEPLAELIVMLLPANRTEQSWWQQMVEPFRDRPRSPLAIEFIEGRLRFLKPGQSALEPNNRPPFGCCLLIWQPLRYTGSIDGGLFGGTA